MVSAACSSLTFLVWYGEDIWRSSITEDSRTSRDFLHNGVCAMTTDIMESINNPVLSHDEDEWKAGDFELEVISWFVEAGAMHCEDP